MSAALAPAPTLARASRAAAARRGTDPTLSFQKGLKLPPCSAQLRGVI